MDDANGLVRLEMAFNRYASFREFATKASAPIRVSPVSDKDWKPFYAKSMIPTLSVRMHSGQTDDVLALREKFAYSRFSIYSKLVSNFSEPDCGCEGAEA